MMEIKNNEVVIERFNYIYEKNKHNINEWVNKNLNPNVLKGEIEQYILKIMYDVAKMEKDSKGSPIRDYANYFYKIINRRINNFYSKDFLHFEGKMGGIKKSEIKKIESIKKMKNEGYKTDEILLKLNFSQEEYSNLIEKDYLLNYLSLDFENSNIDGEEISFYDNLGCVEEGYEIIEAGFSNKEEMRLFEESEERQKEAEETLKEVMQSIFKRDKNNEYYYIAKNCLILKKTQTQVAKELGCSTNNVCKKINRIKENADKIIEATRLIVKKRDLNK